MLSKKINKKQYSETKIPTTKKKKFFVTILDSDGENNPLEIRKMLNLASENNDYVMPQIEKVKESFLIKSLYFTHNLSFFLSNGFHSEFYLFPSKNIDKILTMTLGQLTQDNDAKL